MGRLFSELPGASGTALALTNVGSLAAQLSPLLIGLLAERLGLGNAMWLMLAAPLALLIAVPWEGRATTDGRSQPQIDV
jgi:FSR family fosmidomycin resistance protein-like MFS transporter